MAKKTNQSTKPNKLIDDRYLNELKKKLGTKNLEISIGDSYYFSDNLESVKLHNGRELEVAISSVQDDNETLLYDLHTKLRVS